jgi:hypothetical protein
MIHDDLKHLARPVDDLKLLPGNPRKGDVEAVKRSYERFGQRKPIVALPDGTVIAGNHQLLAARALGWEEIAVVTSDDDEQTAKAFALADNRTSDLGHYDNEALAELLADVAVDPELLLATGYTDADLEALIGEIDVLPPEDKDDEPVPMSAPARTIKGDIWLLGPHRIMCGDCREPTDVDTLLAGSQINLAFTSPPYAEQREYDKSSGFKPIPPDEYVEWFQMVQANVAAHLAHDGSWFVNIRASNEQLDRSLYVMDLVIAHVRQWGWHFGEEYCWERNGVPKQPVLRFKNQWEPVYQFARDRWKFRPDAVMKDGLVVEALGSGAGDTGWANKQGNGLGFGKHKQYEGKTYPGNRLPTFAGSHQATGHTAAFPVGLPEWFVKAYTDEGDTVYDPFMGSGSTLLAAHNQHRIAYGMEISPAYCDIICARFQKATGITPINEATKREHSFID